MKTFLTFALLVSLAILGSCSSSDGNKKQSYQDYIQKEWENTYNQLVEQYGSEENLQNNHAPELQQAILDFMKSHPEAYETFDESLSEDDSDDDGDDDYDGDDDDDDWNF